MTLDGKSNLAFLEAVEDVGLGDGLVSLVFDPPDDRTLRYIVDKNFAPRILRVILNLETNVLEKLRVPERLEITVDGFVGKRIPSA